MEGDPQLTLSLKISPVDDNYLIQPQISIPEQFAPKIVRQSYIFFVLQLRSGLTNDCLISLQRHLLDSCEEIIEQQLKGISFIINGQHHIVQQLSIPHIKDLLNQIMVITENDDYHPTLINVRHSVQTMAQRLHQTKISLVFFFSYVKIDHSLGTKKRSYIDKLNAHSEACSEEIERLSKTIRKFTDECKTYVISFDKLGEQLQDYSMADTQLMSLIIMRVGNYGSSIIRNTGFIQLGDAFKRVACLLYAELYSMTILLPIQPTEKQINNVQKIWMLCRNLNDFQPQRTIFILKGKIDVQKITRNGLSIENYQKLEEKIGQFAIKTQTLYTELEPHHLIVARTQSYCEQIGTICWKLSQEILSYKLTYLAGKCFRQMKVNQALLQDLRQRIDFIYNVSKQIYQQIFSSNFSNKHELFEAYSELKSKLDSVNQVLLSVFKKQLGGTEIGRLSQAIVSGPVKRALKNKLIRRINANPYMLNHIYANITQLIDKGNIDFWNLQVNSQNIRSQLGNCILTDYNFVKALQEYDALGIAFEIQRPESAIGDPGRIRIRQISPSLMRVSKFFQKFLYKIQYSPSLIELVLGRCAICKKYCSYIKYCTCVPRDIIEAKTLRYNEKVVKLETVEWGKDISENTYDRDHSITQVVNFTHVEEGFLRTKGELMKSNYTEAGDYTDRVGRTTTVLGFMPLYLTHEHWKVAKQLMKPCLAFTATGQPLGYVFSQYQIIPFMVLSSLVRTCKQLDYSLQEEKSKVQNCKRQQQLYALETRVNKIKQKIQRFQKLLEAVNLTCKAILIELSSQNYDSKLLATLEQQYRDYQDPINRTIDKISNNSSFLGQLFCAFHNQLLPKPKAEHFHHFFKRLVQEELRRETDGWNQEYTQDCFIDKMLNVESNNIKEWEVSVIGGEEYLDKFRQAEQGNDVQITKVSLQKEELAMMLRKDGKFNESQRLLMIQYKRLYENRVLWMWYVRFRLYGQLQRVQIHKWKCLQLVNSYQLFTLIIQNKKQRKNYKRREAIANGQYADPFNYAEAREYLENEFIQLRSKKQSEMIKIQNKKVCVRAASVFAQSGCLEEVAGTLLGIDKQCKNLPMFYEQLMRGKAVRVEQKLKMLLEGKFKDVSLFKGWKMGKKRNNRLRQKYKYEFGRYQYMF